MAFESGWYSIPLSISRLLPASAKKASAQRTGTSADGDKHRTANAKEHNQPAYSKEQFVFKELEQHVMQRPEGYLGGRGNRTENLETVN